jgi:hypothetical protein
LLIVKNKKSLLKAVLPILVGGAVVMVVAAKLGYQWGRERNEKIIKELEEKDFRNPQQ